MTGNGLKPMLYFSYGLTKSASTLAFRLVCLVLEQAGYRQKRVAPPTVSANHRINFVDDLDYATVDALLASARRQGHPLVVKTHSAPTQAVADAINSGHAIGSASLRDPRDMALSMLDHGVRARATGKFAFREYLALGDTLPEIRKQVDALAGWLTMPQILPLTYDLLAFDTDVAIRMIQRQLELPERPAEIVAKVADKRQIQFNKGVRGRHKTEMPQSDSAALEAEFAPLIQFVDSNFTTSIDGRPALPESARLRL